MSQSLHALTKREIDLGLKEKFHFFSVPALEEAGIGKVSRLPVSLRIVLETVLRNCDGKRILPEHVEWLATWQPNGAREEEIPFTIGRIVLNCAAGIPLLGDLTAIRAAVMRQGYPAETVGPHVPVDMALDHTLTVDYHGTPDALRLNTELDLQRNGERYRFVKWAMQAYGGIRLFPPGAGILHQLNLELLAPGFLAKDGICFPDTLVGTDSHTCMIAGLGVVGWGVGGIEAEAAMLGQPLYFLTPDVVGVHVSNALEPGVTATDLVLHVTEMLRKAKVVGKFVEFFGEGVATLSLPDRATIANMAVEYGATIGYFPVDEQTCRYLRQTGRSEERVRATEILYRAQGCFGAARRGEVDYSQELELDLAGVVPSVAGPKRPQDRVPLDELKSRFTELLAAPVSAGGYGKAPAVSSIDRHVPSDGDVVIAAITSCTNTSNPGVMLAAGLVAKKAVALGLKTKTWVKTSLTPGSRVVSRYLEAAGLQEPLDELGFVVAGYSCATCVGASGPIDAELEKAIVERDVVACAVLSGNRNFEARIHPAVRASFLASPPLVVAFALTGRVDIGLSIEPLGIGADGREVYLRDVWPTSEELAAAYAVAANPEFYRETYAQDIAATDPMWATIPQAGGELYRWEDDSTYLKEPPFLAPELSRSSLKPILGARTLAILGDSVTTDHISPIGSIKSTSPAGAYLRRLHVEPADFNNFGARRMNHEIMVRGGFGNLRLRNLMVPGQEGGVTRHQPSGEELAIYDAALRYEAEGVPLIIVAGQEYGTGSARDWAAKVTRLLGVRAVVANSFERIHRSNLVGMGVLPCQLHGVNATDLELTGAESFDIIGLDEPVVPKQRLTLRVHRANGTISHVPLILRLDTPAEIDYVRCGGIMPYILADLIATVPAVA
ncbi:aconitate hydratase AcnA [Bosea sp. 117]|uniref:aconitate hydratase AcnA n=1 Tax=Bosea sp. 117 TaxID=1125973 RepID=UPI0004941C25|nr:aconitate hydratase AcnA [Bosea sp. 117]